MPVPYPSALASTYPNLSTFKSCWNLSPMQIPLIKEEQDYSKSPFLTNGGFGRLSSPALYLYPGERRDTRTSRARRWDSMSLS